MKHELRFRPRPRVGTQSEVIETVPAAKCKQPTTDTASQRSHKPIVSVIVLFAATRSPYVTLLITQPSLTLNQVLKALSKGIFCCLVSKIQFFFSSSLIIMASGNGGDSSLAPHSSLHSSLFFLPIASYSPLSKGSKGSFIRAWQLMDCVILYLFW